MKKVSKQRKAGSSNTVDVTPSKTTRAFFSGSNLQQLEVVNELNKAAKKKKK